MNVQNIQIQLQARLRRVIKANPSLYNREIGHLVDFITETPALRAILDNLLASDPEFDPADWTTKHIQLNKVEFPSGEVQSAIFYWHLVNDWKDKGQRPAGGFGLVLNRNDRNGGMSEVTANVVEPLIDYFSGNLGTQSDVLYTLARYVQRVEWFDTEPLYERYKENTARGESIYDQDLRRFLFEQGIDYPFSQPASASGRADVVAGLESDDPLVCEVKLFDVVRYSKSNIARGVQQALSYAHDYGKTAAFVVIINLSDQELEFASDGVGEWPPRIVVAGVTVYLIQVRALPMESASKRGPVKIQHISREDLLKNVEDGG